MGLHWMNRLAIALNITSEDIKIHNIKLDETEKKILKLKNEFKDLIYKNTELKNLSVKINLKEDAKILQQKGRSIPIHLQDQVADEIKRLTKRLPGKSNRDMRKLLRKSSSYHSEKGQIGKNSSRFKKNKRSNNKKKSPMPNMEQLISRISRKISEEKEGEIWLTKLDFNYAYGQIKLDDETQNLCILCIYNHCGRRIHGILPFFKGILRTGRYTDHIPGTD